MNNPHSTEPTPNPSTDKVDNIIQQWQGEYPKLSLKSMAILGRLQRCGAVLEPLLTAKFAEFGLNYGEFDVLATLRRSGEPFVLSPTELYSTLMITSGTMTNRLKHLENKGLIIRKPNPNDSRSLLVALTNDGKALIDKAFIAHLDNENALLDGIDDEILENLDKGLKALLLKWEQ